MTRYNKSVIDWFLEQQLFCLTQLLSSDPVNNCIMVHILILEILTQVIVYNLLWASDYANYNFFRNMQGTYIPKIDIYSKESILRCT
jgi:hypothetical protein